MQTSNRSWLVGERFGHYTIVSGHTTRNKWGNVMVLARCVCGVENEVMYENLRRGKSTQCKRCAAFERESRKRSNERNGAE